MRAENQALKLEKMMQEHHLYPEYEMCLPPIAVKKRAFNRLGAGDVLLLGMDQLEVLLLSEHSGCAKAVLERGDEGMTMRIVQILKNIPSSLDSKKYKELRIILGNIQSRVLKKGHKIEMLQIDTNTISLYHEAAHIAKGKLVEVDDEIAVEIKEVTAV